MAHGANKAVHAINDPDFSLEGVGHLFDCHVIQKKRWSAILASVKARVDRRRSLFLEVH